MEGKEATVIRVIPGLVWVEEVVQGAMEMGVIGVVKKREELQIPTTEVRIALVPSLKRGISGKGLGDRAVGKTKREISDLGPVGSMVGITRGMTTVQDLEDSTVQILIEVDTMLQREVMILIEEGQTNVASIKERIGLQRMI